MFRLFLIGLLVLVSCGRTTTSPDPIGDGADPPRSLSRTLDNIIQTETRAGRFMGTVLIAKDGRIVLERGYGNANIRQRIPNTARTRYRLGSINKPFTATLMLALEDDGLIDVDAPIARYLPDYPAGNRITIHHLLTHTSGIVNYTDLPDFDTLKPYLTDLPELVARFADLPLRFEPGSAFNYSNSNYALLAYIAEEVTDKSYTRVMNDYLLRPLSLPLQIESSRSGITRLADGYSYDANERFVPADDIDVSVAMGSGNIVGTARDLYDWDRALARGSVTQAAQDKLFRPYVDVDFLPGVRYGYGWMLRNSPHGREQAHPGGIDGFRSYFARYPGQNAVIIVLANVETDVISLGQRLAEATFTWQARSN
ncbi:MAG: serine hydrolase domain-containing protein [Deinococcota bacterium]